MRNNKIILYKTFIFIFITKSIFINFNQYIRIATKTTHMKIFSLFIPVLFLSCFLYAQKKFVSNYKYGNITAEDFKPRFYDIDSNAQAVILFDGGTANFVSDNQSWFDVKYVYKKRIRIFNKNEFDLATIHIPLYKGEKTEDKIEKLEACTYNLENGEVVKSKIDKEAIFTDKASKNVTIKKITLPNLKEGCIIEYSYTIISPNSYDIRSWVFQDKIPVLQSEYEITVPTLFNFTAFNKGYYQPKFEKEEGSQSYNIIYNNGASRTEHSIYNAITVHSKWVLNNLPAIVKEKFITTMDNHIAKIDFQLYTLNYPDMPPKPFLSTWQELAKELLNDVQFGADLNNRNNWLSDDMKKLDAGSDSVITAKNIFRYVRENFTCTDHDAIYLPENLKKSFEAKKGNIAEINLLLVAMLKKANLKVDPVLLSTTENGKAYELYPLLKKFNYVIARVIINGNEYLLDASRKKGGFNQLPQNCYNGYGRLINEFPIVIDLFPESITEHKFTNIFISNSENEQKINGAFTSKLGQNESYNLREKLSDDEATEFFKKIQAGYSNDVVLSETHIDSLKNMEAAVQIRYNFSIPVEEDIIYFNPLFNEAYKSNPFASANRSYSVEMPYRSSETIILHMDIPKGYKLEELPKSVRMKFNETEAFFEYIIQADAASINLRCTLKMDAVLFDPGDYSSLRDFYGQIVKKQGEQIVFKKLK